MAEDKPSFTLPTIFDNDLGWGPASNVLPDQFRDIPYAPYSKADKLGRIADWSSPEQNKDGQRDTTVSGRGTRQGGYNRYNRGRLSYSHCPRMRWRSLNIALGCFRDCH